MKEISEIKLTEILPENLSADTEIKNCADALDSSLNDVSEEVDIPSLYVRLNLLSSAQLDHMAIQWDASVWRENWQINIKRNVLNNIITEKRKRGTLGAVKAAIDAIGHFSSITEWWEETPRGTPHTFKVTANLPSYEGILDSELQEDLIALINDAKPVRSHYEFILSTDYSGQIGFVGIGRKLVYTRVRQAVINSAQSNGTISVVPGSRPIIIRNIVDTAE